MRIRVHTLFSKCDHEVTKKLIDGLISILQHLDVDEEVIELQKDLKEQKTNITIGRGNAPGLRRFPPFIIEDGMKEIDTSTIGGRIKASRLRKGYSQEKLAELMHLTPPQISYYENDKNDIKVSVLKELASYLQVSISYLVDDELVEGEDVQELISIYRKLSSKRDKLVALVQMKVLSAEESDIESMIAMVGSEQ